MSIQENYQTIKKRIKQIALQYGRDPKEITVIAASKSQPVEHLIEAYHAGCRDFGENKVQEAQHKIENFPHEACWHFIGTLQKNKVRKVIGCFVLIHSVDTPDLAEKISQCSQEAGIETDILIQANTSGEASKHGLSSEEWKKHFEHILNLPSLNIKGLMTMAPLIEDEKAIRNCFAELRILRDELAAISGGRADLYHLSMGMSHDYPLAIAEGATLVRIGSAIFSDANVIK